MFTKLLVLSLLSGSILSDKVRYDNYTLYKVQPEREEHVAFLKDLFEADDGLDFWKPPSVVGEYVSVVAPPEMRAEFELALNKRSISSELMLENIQEAFDAQVVSRRKRESSRELFWTNYQTIEDIYDWFNYLAETRSDIVSVVTIGQSYEGRNITGIKIARGTGKKAFVLEGGQVGADWLSPTVLTYLVDQLVKGTDAEARAASEDFEWHIFPIVNPDGHQFTQDSVRLWVKNRRPTTRTTIGVDLTKNWNSQWGIIGGSFTPAASNYIGLGPFSEVETRSLARYIEGIGPNLVGFLSLRSFGQRLLVPFAHSTVPMYNYQDVLTVGRRAMGSLSVRYGTLYITGTSRLVHSGNTGAAEDWVKHRFNPPISAAYLLRDTGSWGYTLPVNQVLPTCEETFDSVMAIIREAKFINIL